LIIAINVPVTPNTVADPNQPISSESSSTDSKTGSGGLPKGGIIGICVGVGISVYAAATIIGISYYRKRKSRKDEIIKEQHMMFAESISLPIMQGNSLGWVPAPYRYEPPSNNLQY
jgi:hypothetical protein